LVPGEPFPPCGPAGPAGPAVAITVGGVIFVGLLPEQAASDAPIMIAGKAIKSLTFIK